MSVIKYTNLLLLLFVRRIQISTNQTRELLFIKRREIVYNEIWSKALKFAQRVLFITVTVCAIHTSYSYKV